MSQSDIVPAQVSGVLRPVALTRTGIPWDKAGVRVFSYSASVRSVAIPGNSLRSA